MKQHNTLKYSTHDMTSWRQNAEWLEHCNTLQHTATHCNTRQNSIRDVTQDESSNASRAICRSFDSSPALYFCFGTQRFQNYVSSTPLCTRKSQITSHFLWFVQVRTNESGHTCVWVMSRIAVDVTAYTNYLITNKPRAEEFAHYIHTTAWTSDHVLVPITDVLREWDQLGLPRIWVVVIIWMRSSSMRGDTHMNTS